MVRRAMSGIMVREATSGIMVREAMSGIMVREAMNIHSAFFWYSKGIANDNR